MSHCILRNGDTLRVSKSRCRLDLETHRRFSLSFMDTLFVSGEWKFYDTGDAEIIELFPDDSKISHQCLGGVISITPLNPHILLRNPEIKKAEFVAIRKNIPPGE